MGMFTEPPKSQPTLRHPGLPLRTIELIEESYGRIEPRGRAIAIAFYDELFRAYPSLRPVFPRDDAEQRKVALSFIGFIVANLRSPSYLAPLVERMGMRGMLQDLTREEIEAIGRTFLLVLRMYESKLWTLETSHAWALAFAWTVAALHRGADQVPQPHQMAHSA